jgi:hypothetical protein
MNELEVLSWEYFSEIKHLPFICPSILPLTKITYLNWTPFQKKIWIMVLLKFHFYTPFSRRAVLCDWVWRAGIHTGLCTITLVLYIRSLPNLATWFPCGRGRTLFILGSLGQSHYKYNFWQQGRFHTITLVLYIGSLTNLATWFPCGRGRTLFILESLGQRSRSPLL